MTAQNQYQIVKELGRNPEGGRVTSLGLDTSVNPPVKVILKEFRFAQQDANWSGFKAYQQEIAVLQALNHPRIPGYRDSFETAAGFCLVQEYKEASSLDKRRTFKPEEIKQIAVSLLEILVYLQQHVPLVIHRDIKPENILMDKQKNVYLVDFGFARIGREKNAVSSVCAGTMGFMSPEQLFNRPLSKASDIYSLGATLIALVTNTRSANIGNLVDDNGRFDLQGIAPQLNPLFIKWLKKMVEPNSKRRFANAEEALKALQPIDIAGKSSLLTILRDLCKNLNLSPEVRSQIIAGGTGTLIIIIAVFVIPISLKYTIIQFLGGNPSRLCDSIRSGNSDIAINYLKWGGNPEPLYTDKKSSTSIKISLLRCALLSVNRNKYFIEQLIDRGADVNFRSEGGETPLHLIASMIGNDTIELADLLITKGAQVDAKNNSSQTPLSVAIFGPNNIQMAELLISKGADINIKDIRGRTPLHIAAKTQYYGIKLTQLLIAKGANINAKADIGTPLHAAASIESFLTVELLVQRGADVNAKNDSGQTPLDLVSRNNRNLNLIKFLQSHSKSQ
ncbi:MAG: ankyrin repeat domain-containing protein [Oscillatoriaceae cyanobacterium Prado104]|jgi:serine/threonine protein kinase|nr:ankyrin repeat domain-containing protein [Oscillatoriaceae cyanobacterium Prado104]